MSIGRRTETIDIGGERAAGPTDAGLVTLFAADPKAVPSAVVLREGQIILGRDPPPGELTLPFNSVSRVHARVTVRESEIAVEDLDSRNGTFVNGIRTRRAILEHDDEVRVGDVVFKLVTTDAASYLAHPLAGVDQPAPFGAMLGGAAMERVRRELLLIARADLSILTLGETGTGKELVARALHDASARSGAFCAVNCAAIPSALLESELFGHKRGAFTGADRDRIGMIHQAHEGTLFLDEVGDMPLEAQAKVLRVIENRTVTPLGGRVSEAVDVRIVCATHRPLPRMVRDGGFRADLFARISGHTILLPPLRERKEDIFQLARRFVARAGGPPRTLSPAFLIGLIAYDWPFNVRELETAMKRVVALTPSDLVLEARHLPLALGSAHDATPEAEERPRDDAPSADREHARAEAPDAETMRAMMERHGGNVAAVARELKKDRVQVHRWLKRHGLSPEEFRRG